MTFAIPEECFYCEQTALQIECILFIKVHNRPANTVLIYYWGMCFLVYVV